MTPSNVWALTMENAWVEQNYCSVCTHVIDPVLNPFAVKALYITLGSTHLKKIYRALMEKLSTWKIRLLIYVCQDALLHAIGMGPARVVSAQRIKLPA